MSEKRTEPFWQLPGVVKQFDSGAEVREESIGADHVLIHVTVPGDIEAERLAAFARSFSKELPKNARAVFTHEDIRINVQRPRSVSLSFVGNTIEGDTLLKDIQQLLDDSSITNIHIQVQNNNIIQPEVRVAVQPPPVPVESIVALGSTTVVEEVKGNNGHGETRPVEQRKGTKDRRGQQKKGGSRKSKST